MHLNKHCQIFSAAWSFGDEHFDLYLFVFLETDLLITLEIWAKAHTKLDAAAA